jgi:hypothetical protein
MSDTQLLATHSHIFMQMLTTIHLPLLCNNHPLHQWIYNKRANPATATTPAPIACWLAPPVNVAGAVSVEEISYVDAGVAVASAPELLPQLPSEESAGLPPLPPP